MCSFLLMKGAAFRRWANACATAGLLLLLPAHIVAQQPPQSDGRFDRVGVDNTRQLPLSLRQAIGMALEKNRDIEVQRMSVKKTEFDLFSAQGVYDPVSGATTYYDSRTVPVGSVLAGGPTGRVTTKSFVYNFSLEQQVKTGGRYNLSFENARNSTTSTFVNLNPQFSSVVQFNFTQPLLRNFRIDRNRHEIKIAKKRLGVADSQFRQRVIDILSSVQNAYWELVYSIRNRTVAEDAVNLARKQFEMNQRLVGAGTLAPVEIVSAKAEVERREESVLQAVENVAKAENALKGMILDSRTSEYWEYVVLPTDGEEIEPVSLKLDDAIAIALKNRPELEQVRLQSELNTIDTGFFRNQTRPQIDFLGQYGFTGLSGRARPSSTLSTNQALIDRVDFLSSLQGLGPVPVPPPATVQDFLVGGYGRDLSNLFGQDFRSVRVGFTVSLPVRNRTAQANLGRSLAEGRILDAERQQLEQRVVVEVRNALQSVRTAEKRLQAARESRVASEKQLESEDRQYEAGETTNFLVLTRQNELSAARGREIRALADYNEAIAALQRATSVTLSVYNVSINADTPKP